MMNNGCCPRCGANCISYQREQVATVGTSKYKFKEVGVKKKHGVMYWIFLGWWIWMFKLVYEMFRWLIMACTLGLVGRKKKPGVSGKAISANKSINCTMAVCQNCGYSWKI